MQKIRKGLFLLAFFHFSCSNEKNEQNENSVETTDDPGTLKKVVFSKFKWEDKIFSLKKFEGQGEPILANSFFFENEKGIKNFILDLVIFSIPSENSTNLTIYNNERASKTVPIENLNKFVNVYRTVTGLYQHFDFRDNKLLLSVPLSDLKPNFFVPLYFYKSRSSTSLLLFMNFEDEKMKLSFNRVGNFHNQPNFNESFVTAAYRVVGRSWFKIEKLPLRIKIGAKFVTITSVEKLDENNDEVLDLERPVALRAHDAMEMECMFCGEKKVKGDFLLFNKCVAFTAAVHRKCLAKYWSDPSKRGKCCSGQSVRAKHFCKIPANLKKDFTRDEILKFQKEKKCEENLEEILPQKSKFRIRYEVEDLGEKETDALEGAVVRFGRFQTAPIAWEFCSRDQFELFLLDGQIFIRDGSAERTESKFGTLLEISKEKLEREKFLNLWPLKMKKLKIDEKFSNSDEEETDDEEGADGGDENETNSLSFVDEIERLSVVVHQKFGNSPNSGVDVLIEFSRPYGFG